MTKKKAESVKPALPTTLKIDEIQVPELRVTSQLDQHILEELTASIAEKGVLQPLQVALVGGNFILEDGLHRLMASRHVGLQSVPVIVHEATEAEVLGRNLLLNRQRGKSNPAEEAKVICHLVEVEGKGVEEVAVLTGLSQGWVSRLHDLSGLPPEILSLISEGLLAVTSSWHLTKLTDPEMQIQVARDAANWRYTEQQVKVRVDELRGARPEIQPGEPVFKNSGEVTIVPLTCYFCHREVEKADNYIWVCPEHRALIDAFWEQYVAGQPPAPTEVGVAAPKKMVLTDQGWAPQG